MEYGYQGLYPGSKVQYLLNDIRCDKLSTVVTIVRTHLGKEKDFNAVVVFLTQYIEKRAPTQSVKFASVGQNRPAKQQKTSTICGTFKEKIELKKYSKDEYDSMLMAQHQQLYELWKKARLIKVRRSQKQQIFRA